jgi:NAD(P)-dependent dehydrogenase (short-subunit alcohol dehydrogenase family)
MNILLTGAARGMGLGICEHLAARGDTVFATCRKVSDEFKAIVARHPGRVHVIDGVDVAEDAAIARMKSGIGAAKLDGVICNAAINASFDTDGVLDLDLGISLHEYQTNALGAVRTVKAALPSMGAGGKLLFITTGPQALGKRAPAPGVYGYRMSKGAMHTFANLLTLEMKPKGIAVQIVTPGSIDTKMLWAVWEAGRTPNKPKDALSIDEGGRRIVARFDELTLEKTGTWVTNLGEPEVV